MKKTIAILSNHDILTYKFRKEILQALLTKGYRVVLVLPYGEKIEEMKSWGCEFIDLPEYSRHGTNGLKELQLLAAYRRILKSVKPDLVMAYTIKPNLYGGFMAATLGIPFVANITGLGMAVQNDGALQRIVKRMYSVCLRKAACIFAQNHTIKDFLTERNLKGKIVVTSGSGVNLEQHYFEEYPENDENLTFITVGRLMQDKGTEEVLSAAKEIKEKYPQTRFQLIGFDDGDYEEKVMASVNAGIVEYPGFQDDVHPWIAKSHAIIHASYHEGMANVLLECAATGRPIIATDIPGCRETFDEGISGIGFKPQDTGSLVEAIETFIALPYEEKKAMGVAGRKKMEMEFDRRFVVDACLKEIENIIG